MNKLKNSLLLLFFILLCGKTFSQATVLAEDTILPANPMEFVIEDVKIVGNVLTDGNAIKLICNIYKGDKFVVPGEKISDAIKNLWRNQLFDEIEISAQHVSVSKATLTLVVSVKEKPRMWNVKFVNVSKSDKEDLQEKIRFAKGKFLTEFYKGYAKNIIYEFYRNKSFLNCSVEMTEVPVTAADNCPKPKEYVWLVVKVTKNKKVKIKDIFFVGNDSVKSKKLYKKMKDTKRKRWWNPFNNGKYLEENVDKDKDNIQIKYNSLGYRDMRVVKDSMWPVSEKRVSMKLWIEEGRKYHFRNITWVGNTVYRSGTLDTVLGIKKGDVFDQSLLEQKLSANPNGADIQGLYMDNGYLFFQIMPTEVLVENDSIDLEMRMYEGKPAIINRVTVIGNTKTNDRVIMREIRTRPGMLFRRSDIMRTQRELSALGYFDPEKMGVNPIPNQADGTVDIEYTVEEKPSDQIQLSGGWGGGRVIGTLGVTFNNFSTKNFFKRGAWQPLPAGDGQKLSVQAQSTGAFYRSFNFSFTEPWLGGKRPNSLTFSAYHTVSSNGVPGKIKDADGNKIKNPALSDIKITGVTFGFASRLKKPDDWFSFYGETNFSHYNVNNYSSFFVFSNGQANDVNVRLSLNRDSREGYIWYKSGAYINVSGQFTPPYSMWNGKKYLSTNLEDNFRWIEYQKYKFSAEWYAPLTNVKVKEGKEARNLVLRLRTGYGFLASYNKKVGTAPFERFYLGGSGLSGFNTFFAREIIALRGYQDNSISSKQGDAFIAKYTAELRYPVSLNPQAMIWVQGFAEAGNSWQTLKEFNPFKLYRSAGVGVRIFLPMFGLLGLDYGWRFDTVNKPGTAPMPKGQLHFTIGAQLGDL
ncbi:MAG: outer membrane protein assembly factor BamA [Bacteroidia bacterium]|nr:outer membrane protein assembly factor BamA [Bacteroidia bacterium]